MDEIVYLARANIVYINIILHVILIILLILQKKEIYSIRKKYENEIFDLDIAHAVNLKKHVEQSRNVLKGKISEELFPILKDCPYLPADMKFFGSPIDYVILNGYSEAKDNGGDFQEIIFADIKTGNARLSSHQKKIKKAVQDGRVRWETIRMNDDGSIVFERD